MRTEADFQLDSVLDAKAQVSETADGDILIEGLASDWGQDDQNEYMEPGCFDRAVEDFKASGNLPLLYHHDGGKALGQVIDLENRPAGLWMRARIDRPRGGWADDVVEKVKRGTIRGLSVRGKFERRVKDGAIRIYRAGLREISVTPFPVNPRTLFQVAQKAFDEDDQLEALERTNANLDAALVALATKAGE